MKKIRAFIIFVSSGILLLTVTIYFLHYSSWVVTVNLTNSEAKGFYLLKLKETKFNKGDLVIVCVPDERLAKLALNRGYLSTGSCPYKTAFEVKQVVGTYSDKLDIVKGYVLLDKNAYPIQTKDSNLRSIPSILKPGFIPENKFFVAGRGSDSFDSRYYGLVPASFIKGRAKLLYSWDKL